MTSITATQKDSWRYNSSNVFFTYNKIIHVNPRPYIYNGIKSFYKGRTKNLKCVHGLIDVIVRFHFNDQIFPISQRNLELKVRDFLA